MYRASSVECRVSSVECRESRGAPRDCDRSLALKDYGRARTINGRRVATEQQTGIRFDAIRLPSSTSPHLALHTIPGPATGYGAVADPSSGHTFFPSPGAVIVADTATGIILRTAPVAHGEISFFLDAAQRRVIALSNAETDDGTATATTIDTVSGRPLRTERLVAGQCRATLASSFSRLLVLCTPPEAGQGATEEPAVLETLDTTSGAVIASTSIGLSGPHTFYAGPALDDATGKAFITWERPSPAVPAWPHLGHYVATIDIATGHALRTVQLAKPGGFSNTLAVDAIRGRVVDIDAGADNTDARYPTTVYLLDAADGTVRNATINNFSVTQRSFAPINDPGPERGRRYFPSTHHTLSGRFLTYWLVHHGSVVLGAPISEPFVEGNEEGSGRRYLLQWFEKGRLEYHPEFAGSRYEVEQGSSVCRRSDSAAGIPDAMRQGVF